MEIADGICFYCNSEEDIQNHHAMPRSMGGVGVLPTCAKCHAKIHNVPERTWVNHKELVKKGLEKARERGVVLGRPSSITPDNQVEIKKLRSEGVTYEGISNILKLPQTSVYRWDKLSDEEIEKIEEKRKTQIDKKKKVKKRKLKVSELKKKIQEQNITIIEQKKKIKTISAAFNRVFSLSKQISEEFNEEKEPN